jgi:hypothetical protein
MGVTGSRGDGTDGYYLVEIRVNGDTWYVSPDQIMRVALRAKR